MQYARWLWPVLPACIALAFNKLILSALTFWHQMLGGIAPWVFFYLPFLSVIPPLLLFAIWYLRQRRDPRLQQSICRRDTLIRDVGIGAVGAGLCVIAFVGSQKILRSLGVAAPELSSLSLTHHLFFSTIGALIPGIAEELYFRGFLMARFRDVRPALLIVLTSVSFSLWHILTPSYLLHTFIIGLILGLVVYRTRSLLPAIIAHSLANVAAGVIFIKGYV